MYVCTLVQIVTDVHLLKEKNNAEARGKRDNDV